MELEDMEIELDIDENSKNILFAEFLFEKQSYVFSVSDVLKTSKYGSFIEVPELLIEKIKRKEYFKVKLY